MTVSVVVLEFAVSSFHFFLISESRGYSDSGDGTWAKRRWGRGGALEVTRELIRTLGCSCLKEAAAENTVTYYTVESYSFFTVV